MQYTRPDTILDVRASEHGLPLDDFEYYAYELMTGKELLAAYRKAELDGYDAILQGCWYDPGVREGREILKIPITGICEASCHVGSLLGHKFSVIVGQRKWIAKMEENIVRYGFGPKIASWRVVDLHVADFRDDREATMKALVDISRKCVQEDGAEVILTACGGFETYTKEASEKVGVPIVNPVQAGVMLAEWLADLYHAGLKPSKMWTYESPPLDKLRLLDELVPRQR